MAEKFGKGFEDQNIAKQEIGGYTEADMERFKASESYWLLDAQMAVERAAKKLGVSINGEWEGASRDDAQFAPEAFVVYADIIRLPNGELSREESFAHLVGGEIKEADPALNIIRNEAGKNVIGRSGGGISIFVPRTERSPSEIAAALELEKFPTSHVCSEDFESAMERLKKETTERRRTAWGERAK